ncbi:RNA polymerase sigma-70 factor, ECF subfamily [Terribacillus halophilus]|uniref:RNA polymerase sigma-70 factor, ECF subfamily n=1 Tax=Terribacillus halophilus TaxID=361279 RepID=A0A1G6L2F5_9BACI|nr:sigma-70 family RNA polymerase sigma factor [Terribacillus halophilus]SDC36915.1 RNA polymerase sigma-70 factor, ECF subfamily [Terribacillus halophilus]
MDNHIKLVKKAIRGNDKAFEKLVEIESEKLYRTALLYAGNKEDALDVLQETIYKAYISIDQVKQPEFFSTWLTKILIRTSYDFLKKKKKIILDENYLSAQHAKNNSDIEGKLDLLHVISKLNRDYQTVIILFYYHDLPIRCIGETLNMAENTVKTNLRRAKIELKRLLGGMEYEQTAFQ